MKYCTPEDLRAAGVEVEALERAGDLIYVNGELAMVDGTEHLAQRIRQRLERAIAADRERRARDRRTWSLGLSRWIDRWTPYYISPADLLAGDEKLAQALRCIAQTVGVVVPRA